MDLVKHNPASLVLAEAQQLADAIEQEVKGVLCGEITLDRQYARLAGMLAKFKQGEGWRALGHTSMARYLMTLQEKYSRSKFQLWAYTEVAEKLLPAVGEAGLDKMGVSKAFELTKASKQAGKPVTAELIAAALDENTTAKEIRATAHQIYNLPEGQQPRGTWFDLGGFYIEPEERKEFKEFFEIGERLLNLKKELPEWVKRKTIIQAAVREFNGAHAVDVYGPGAEKEEPTCRNCGQPDSVCGCGDIG